MFSGIAIPYLYGTVFTAAADGHVGVEYSKAWVVRMSFHRLHAAFAKVVPNLDSPVITCRDELWGIRGRAEVDAAGPCHVCP